MGKLIHGNKTTGITKQETGKYQFKIRLGSNKQNATDFGLFDRRKTIKVATDAEAKKIFKKWVQEQELEYNTAKTAHLTKNKIAKTKYIREDAPDALRALTFKVYTAEDGLFWQELPLTVSGEAYSVNSINSIKRTISIINSDYPEFNNKLLAQITEDDAEELFKKIRKRTRVVNKAENRTTTISNATISTHLSNMRIIFGALENIAKLRKKGSNPFLNIKVGRVRYKQDGKTSLNTVEEYAKVKEEVKTLLYPRPPKKEFNADGKRAPMRKAQPAQALLFLFAMISMLRRSEASALRWSDINYEEKIVSIKGIFEADDDSLRPTYRKYTKSHEVRETIITNELIEILKQLEPKRKVYWTDDSGVAHDLIFLDKSGQPYRLDYWSKAWKKFRDELVEKGIIKNTTTLHDLRGSGISYYLIELNMPVVTLAKMVGHADVAMTLNVYANATPANIRQFAQDVDNPEFLAQKDHSSVNKK